MEAESNNHNYFVKNAILSSLPDPQTLLQGHRSGPPTLEEPANASSSVYPL